MAFLLCEFISVLLCSCFLFFFFKQKTAYEMRISDWSSDVCSSDLDGDRGIAVVTAKVQQVDAVQFPQSAGQAIGVVDRGEAVHLDQREQDRQSLVVGMQRVMQERGFGIAVEGDVCAQDALQAGFADEGRAREQGRKDNGANTCQ